MKLLLCTDLDRTLLPNGPQPESKLSRERFHALTNCDEVTLVYVTGRDKGLVQQAIKNFQLPQPDFVVADVGSSIYKVDQGAWQHWQVWEEQIQHDWQGETREDLQESLVSFKDLRIQEFNKQNKHKLSYYVPLYVSHMPLLNKIRTRFEERNIQVNLIWSIDELANTGLLDILPGSASKRHAIEFIMQQLGFGLNETIFAGDSGNDISVIASPVQSILVANASVDVKETAMRQAQLNDHLESVYIARGGFLDMNGNYSAGILEGVAHYMPEAEKWMILDHE